MESSKRRSALKSQAVRDESCVDSIYEILAESVPMAPSYDDFPLLFLDNVGDTDVRPGPASLKTEFDILEENMSCCSTDTRGDEIGHHGEHVNGSTFQKSDAKAVVASAPVQDEGFSEISPSPVFSTSSQISTEKRDLFQALISEGVHVLSSWTKREAVTKAEASPYLTLQQKMDEIVTAFVSMQTQIYKHELYGLINMYKQSRSLLSGALKDYSILQSEIEKFRKSVWIESKVTIVEDGACLDGKTVHSSVEYPVAKYDENREKELTYSLKDIQKLMEEKISLYQNSCELQKKKIEHYFYSVTCCIGETESAVDELKLCTNILFDFLRQPIRDQHCVGAFRHWVAQLISVLIVASKSQEVLFVLNHLLRCPSGVGKWSSNFLQLPNIRREKGFDETILFLSVLMSRIDHRDLFLEDLRKSLQNNVEEQEESPWTYLDSEGEEEENGRSAFLLISGNDLSSFIDQVDIVDLINYILEVSGNPQFVDNVIWKTFENAQKLMMVFESGLKTYSSDRYRHFSKKILRILKVLIQSLTDFWQDCLEKNRISNAVTLSLLQLEFDAMFLSFCSAIKGSGCQGAWQVMSTLSYNTLSYDAMWRLYAQLHDSGQIVRDESLWLSDAEFWPRFEEYLSLLSEAEIFSFLATLTSMALSRNVRGDDFIKLVAWELCEVGFVCGSTRDSASKGAKDLLCTLTSKFPHVLSFLLDRLHGAKASMGRLSLALWKALPLHLWSPTYDDLSVLHQWMVSHSVNSLESHLSRIILESLNYEPVSLLDHQKQEAIGIIVVEACRKHIPEILPSGGIIGDSVRQVSSFANTILQGHQTPVQVFHKWSWNLMGRLRLHLMDQSPQSVSWALANQREAFNAVTSFEQDPRLEPVREAIASKQPQAAYLALITTTVGHTIPEFCTIGIRHLTLLASGGFVDQVLDIIHKVTPLFFQCPDSLYSSHEYISIITKFLTEDAGYMKFAKSLIMTQQLSQHVKRMAAIIEDHMLEYRRFNLTSLLPITTLWLETLLCVTDWNTNRNALFIFDVVLRGAFFCENSRQYARKLFEDLVKIPPESQEDRTLPKLLGMIGPLGVKTLGHPLIPIQSLPDFPWLTWFDLIAYTSLEQQPGNNLWKTFLSAFGSGKYRNAEHAYKESIQLLNREVKPFSDITLFRWIEAFLQLEVGHPLEPVYLQQFFLLYMERTPKSGPIDVTGGLGTKIFESAREKDLIKMASTRIKTTCEDLKASLTSSSFPSFEDKTRTERIASMYEAFCHWIDDGDLMDSTVYIPNLPLSYCPKKLLDIFSGSETIWLEFVNYYAVREERGALLSFWVDYKQISTLSKTQRPAASTPALPFEEKLQSRLATLPKPLPPPAFVPLRSLLPEFRLEMLAKPTSLTAFLTPYIRTLVDHAKMFSQKIGQLSSLNRSLLELLPSEFKGERKRFHSVQMCDGVVEELEKGRKTKSPCCGGAAILFEYVQSVRNESVVAKIMQNREDYDIVLAKLLETPPSSVIVAILALEHSIRFLQHAKTRSDPSSKKLIDALGDVGAFFFFFLLDFMDENVKSYPPTTQCFSNCLESLGKDFISNRPKQCLEIIRRLASGGQDYAGHMAPHFSPLGPLNQEQDNFEAASTFFVEAYKLSLDMLFDKQLILFSLLTKFDLNLWLSKYQPSTTSQLEMLRVLFLAFEKFGRKPEEETKMTFEVVRRQYRLVLAYEFPLHYISCLRLVLESSSSQNIAEDIWFDFLCVISNGVIDLKAQLSFNLNRDVISRFVAEQKRIALKETMETVEVLVRHFSSERQNHGLYGLFPRYRPYMDPISVLLYTTARIACLTTIDINRLTPSHTIIDRLWPLIRDLYAPWICTYSPTFVRQSHASWTQHLSDDKLRLLPWVSTDAPLAASLMNGFLDIVTLLAEQVPSDQGVLSYVFLFYVENICHPGVRTHVSDVYHSGFSSLSWEKYSPTVGDVELMITNISLPETNSFFAHLLVLVKWKEFLSAEMNVFGPVNLARGLSLLLHLVIRLSGEKIPREGQREKFLSLLSDLGYYPWYLVETRVVDEASHWLLATIDPWVSLSHNDCHDVDKALWRVFAFTTALVKSDERLTMEAQIKRQLYVRCWSRLANAAATKNPKLVVEREDAVATSIKDLLDTIETAVLGDATKKEQQVVELSAVLSEFFILMKDVSELGRISSIVYRRWLSSRPSGHPALLATMGSVALTNIQPKILAEILETCLESQFELTGESSADFSTWDTLLPVVQLPDGLRVGSFVDCSIETGSFLCLHVYLSKKVDYADSLDEYYTLLNMYCRWLRNVNLSDSIEPKFFLTWSQILKIIERISQLEFVPSSDILADYVTELSDQIATLCGTQSSWNLLSRFRTNKTTLSVRGRLMSHLLMLYTAKKLEKLCQDKTLPPVVYDRFLALLRIWTDKVTLLKSSKSTSDYAPLVSEAIRLMDDETSFSQWKDFWIIISRLFKNRYLVV